MIASVVDEVARLARRDRGLTYHEFRNAVYNELPADDDERIACLGDVVDAVMAGDAHAAAWSYSLAADLYATAFSECDLSFGVVPRRIRAANRPLVEDIIGMNHPALGNVGSDSHMDAANRDVAHRDRATYAAHLWQQLAVIDKDDGLRPVSEQNAARVRLIADAVVSGQYSLAESAAARVTPSRNQRDETILERLTTSIIASADEVGPLVHLLAITGALRAHPESARLARAIWDRSELSEESSSAPNIVCPPEELEWVMRLGRSSIAALLAEEPAAAQLLAQIAIARTDSLWHFAGEVVLAEYVLIQTEPNPQRRLVLLRRACEATQYGNLFPLFTRLELDLAMLERDLAGVDVRDRVERASFLYRKRDVIEGHIWDPRKVKPLTDQIPFTVGELEQFAQLVGAPPPEQRGPREVHSRYVRYPVVAGVQPYCRPGVGSVDLTIFRARATGAEMVTVKASVVRTVSWSDDCIQLGGWATLDGAEQHVRATYRTGKGDRLILGSLVVFRD